MHPISLCTSFVRRWADDAPCPSPLDWPLERDLVVWAHRAIEQLAGKELTTAIEVTKRVPVGGGLGGGSSEAAATLMGLNELHALDLTTDQLAQAANRLGSDVGFFLCEPLDDLRPALVTGMGDTFERVQPAQAGVVLVVPSFGCSTTEVYRVFDGIPQSSFDADRVRALAGSDPLEAELFNDLAEAACRVQPELDELIVAAQEASGRVVHVTGSGSTLFVLCAQGEQEELASRLSRHLSPAAVVPCELCSPAG